MQRHARLKCQLIRLKVIFDYRECYSASLKFDGRNKSLSSSNLEIPSGSHKIEKNQNDRRSFEMVIFK